VINSLKQKKMTKTQLRIFLKSKAN